MDHFNILLNGGWCFLIRLSSRYKASDSVFTCRKSTVSALFSISCFRTELGLKYWDTLFFKFLAFHIYKIFQSSILADFWFFDFLKKYIQGLFGMLSSIVLSMLFLYDKPSFFQEKSSFYISIDFLRFFYMIHTQTNT